MQFTEIQIDGLFNGRESRSIRIEGPLSETTIKSLKGLVTIADPKLKISIREHKITWLKQ